MFWIIGVMVSVLVTLTLGFDIQPLIQAALLWVRDLGVWGAIAFVGLYSLSTVLFVPGFLLTLGAGALFGLGLGFVSVFGGACIGATLAFLIGRYLIRGWVMQQINKNPRSQAIDQAIAQQGFKIVLLMRLSPVFPFTLLNYVLGVTQVSLRDYLAGFVGMIPGTLMYVYLGAALGSVTNLTQHRERTSLEWILYGMGLLATVIVTVIITRIARDALNQEIAPSPLPQNPTGDHRS